VVLVAAVEDAWEKKRVAAALMMDVKGAFPIVNRACLLHKMRAAHLDENLVEWVDSFMSDRLVEITIAGEAGEAIATNTGLPQGSPVSPILFLIYIVDLVALVETQVPDTVGLSFVDNVTWVVDGTNAAEVTMKLMRYASACLSWAASNAVRFEADKTEAILFSKPRANQVPPHLPVQVDSHCITYNPNAIRWLGYWLDPKLTFNHHHQKWLTKAYQQQARLARLCRSQGLPPASTANLQKAVVQSVATYSSNINAAYRYPSRDVGRITSLQLILNHQARAVTVCLRMTPLGFLMAEAATHPAQAIVRVQEARFRSCILTRAAPLPALTNRHATPTEDVIRCLTQHAASRCGFSEVETIHQPSAMGHNPGDIIITPRAEAELMAHNWRNLDAVCIWTDGSRMEHHMGAGFVWEVNGALVSSEFYLGKHIEVLDAELFAIYRALRDFWANRFWLNEPPMAVTTFSDVQAGLDRLRTDSPGPGQSLGWLINAEAVELWKWCIPIVTNHE
jgi:hypothetical protein